MSVYISIYILGSFLYFLSLHSVYFKNKPVMCPVITWQHYHGAGALHSCQIGIPAAKTPIFWHPVQALGIQKIAQDAKNGCCC